MKKIALIAGVAMLAACAETAEAPVEEVAANDADDMMMEEAAATAPDGGPVEGTYDIIDADGNVVGSTTVNADYSYSYSESGEEVAAGTMSMNDEGQACFDADGDDEGPVCYRDGEVAEDGSWESFAPDGSMMMIKRQAG